MFRDFAPKTKGRGRFHRVTENFPYAMGGETMCLPARAGDLSRFNLWTPAGPFSHNDTLYEWATIFGQLLLRQGLNFGIGGMYIEFENTAEPGDPVTPPIVTRDADQGIDYYDALAGSGVRDYLRVPLVAGTLTSSDPVNFPKGNVSTFFAQTTGLVGVHGKTFSDVVNSVVFGAALVSFVDLADATQDLILSRLYKDSTEQIAKTPTIQVGVEWQYIGG